MVASLLLPISGSNINVKVHPVVLLQICDSYIRRGEKQDRVIGTLLGTVSEGTVNVSGCFVVPHTETMDQVSCLRNHKVMFNDHFVMTSSSQGFQPSLGS
jgi:translation initiation factor 3 subunit F